MLVKYLLLQKGRDVEYIHSSETLASAGKRLAAKNIGAVLICDDDDRLVGILSERDIIRIIGENDLTVLARPVSDFMKTSVIACREDDTLEFVMNLMARGGCRHIPVQRGDAICGMLSATDVVRSLDQMYCIADFTADYQTAERLAA